MTNAEAANALQGLADNNWLINLRAVNSNGAVTWMCKAVKDSNVFDASGPSFREMAAELMAKIAP